MNMSAITIQWKDKQQWSAIYLIRSLRSNFFVASDLSADHSLLVSVIHRLVEQALYFPQIPVYV